MNRRLLAEVNLQKAETFADEVFDYLRRTIRDLVGEPREVLKSLGWFFGYALTGGPLVYWFFVINPDPTWVEVIPIFVGMVLLSVPIGLLLFTAVGITFGCTSLTIAVLLKGTIALVRSWEGKDGR